MSEALANPEIQELSRGDERQNAKVTDCELTGEPIIILRGLEPGLPLQKTTDVTTRAMAARATHLYPMLKC